VGENELWCRLRLGGLPQQHILARRQDIAWRATDCKRYAVSRTGCAKIADADFNWHGAKKLSHEEILSLSHLGEAV
jgi:hypothetical protein